MYLERHPVRQQTIVFSLNDRVAFAYALFELLTIDDRDMPAVVLDDSRLLQLSYYPLRIPMRQAAAARAQDQPVAARICWAEEPPAVC